MTGDRAAQPSPMVESCLVPAWPRPGKRTTQTRLLRTVTDHGDYDHGGRTGCGTYWPAAALPFGVGQSCASILTLACLSLACISMVCEPVCERCGLFRSRRLVIALCVAVFLLALSTRLCLFEPHQRSIKAFADDYDRLKVRAQPNRSRHSVVSVRPVTPSDPSFSPLPAPTPELYAAVFIDDVAPRRLGYVGLPGSIRPPPLP